MQRLAQRIWTPASRWHIGDLVWDRFQHVGREPEWPTALWGGSGEVDAWGWMWHPGELGLCVDPARAELVPEVLDWFESRARAEEVTVYFLDREEHIAAGLTRKGYVSQEEDAYHVHMMRELSDLPSPNVPDGFKLRHLQGPQDIAARVAVHRSAFHPSRVTEESYGNVRNSWPYREDLDWVVEAPDGTFAAFCLMWLDEANSVAELEPVGAHPDYRRLGLASAACLGAMRAASENGAARAIVYPPGRVDPVPMKLYASIGFQAYARTVRWVKRIR